MGKLELWLYRLLPVPLYGALRVYCWLAGRDNPDFKKRLGLVPPAMSSPNGIWFHVASVGEVSAIAPIALEVQTRFPHLSIFVTTMTKTGLERASRAIASASYDLIPYDFIYAMRRYVYRVRPSALVIGETEIWPNLVVEAKRLGSRLALVNGRISPSSFKRYMMIKGMMGEILKCFDCLLMRTEADGERIRMLGASPETVIVVGNTKYDMLPSPLAEDQRQRIRSQIGLSPDRKIIAVGSVREGETRKILRGLGGVIKTFRPLVIIVPRHLDYVKEIENALACFGYSFSRLDENQDSVAQSLAEVDALIVAKMGKLMEIYSISDIAIIGGTFEPYGGHNPLEPASQGVVTIAGPYIDNIREDMFHLEHYGGAFVAHEGNLEEIVLNLLRDSEMLTRAGKAALEATRARRGASRRCVEILVDKGVIATR